MLNLIRLKRPGGVSAGPSRPRQGPLRPRCLPRLRPHHRAASGAAGGRQVWAGEPQVMVTGPQAEAWDLAFIVEYPGSQAFIDMVRDPDYRERRAAPHRRRGRLPAAAPGAARRRRRASATSWREMREGRHFGAPRGILAAGSAAMLILQAQLRMLRPRPAARQPRRAHLHLRMHLLRRLRGDPAGRRLPQLRRRLSRPGRSARRPCWRNTPPRPSASTKAHAACAA